MSNIIDIGDGKDFKEDWDKRAVALGALEASAFGPQSYKQFAEFYGAVIADRIVKLGLLSMRDRVLEVGVGAGKTLKYLAPRVYNVVGVDVSPKMLEAAREMVGHLNNVLLVQNDGYGFPFLRDEQFDFVYAYAFFIHIPAAVQWRYLYEMIRVLRRGGEALINVRYGQKFKKYVATYTGGNFDEARLSKLLELADVRTAELLEITRADSLCRYVDDRRWLRFQKV